MSKLLNQDVVFINNNLDEDIKNILKSKEKGIFLLENLRFNEGEIMNDEKFAKGISSPFDTYILDAFGASHREHASIVKIGNHLNSFQGPLMSKEIEELDKVLNESNQDFTIILGGAKVSDKLALIKNLLPRVNSLLIGGGMCFTFLKALGHNIGNSLCEDQFTFDSWNWMISNILISLFLGLFLTALGLTTYWYVVKVIKPLAVSTITYLEPVTGVVLGALILNENLEIKQIIGFSIVLLVGVLQVYLDSKVNPSSTS